MMVVHASSARWKIVDGVAMHCFDRSGCHRNRSWMMATTEIGGVGVGVRREWTMTAGVSMTEQVAAAGRVQCS